MRKVICLVLALMLTACAALAETKITVNGNGVVLVPADTAVITLGVTEQAKDVLEAQNAVNTKIDAVRAALIESGIEAEDINTDRIRIYAQYDYSSNIERIVGYNASSYLAIRTLDMQAVGTIIDVSFTAGANTLNDIAFSASDNEEAKAQALKDAVKNALNKATLIAEAAGLTVTNIQAISESNSYSYDSGLNSFYTKAQVAEDSARGASTLVQAAKISVTADVVVVVTAE